ncbi:MAG: hypothetical protein ISN29_02500 [Gammaproteobacteria bacterium AqS3]|nr:hypothetical protein [Gammaproteobacteria bacterium AqS3]
MILGALASALAPGVVDAVNKWVDHKFPDVEETKRKELAAELQVQLAQLQVNANAAQHPSMFVAGARSFILWVCGCGIAAICLLFVIDAFDIAFMPIDSDAVDRGQDFILSLAIPLLGLGSMRTYEKIKGVARHNLGR